jgi:hypothetical protein
MVTEGGRGPDSSDGASEAATVATTRPQRAARWSQRGSNCPAVAGNWSQIPGAAAPDGRSQGVVMGGSEERWSARRTLMRSQARAAPAGSVGCAVVRASLRPPPPPQLGVAVPRSLRIDQPAWVHGAPTRLADGPLPAPFDGISDGTWISSFIVRGMEHLRAGAQLALHRARAAAGGAWIEHRPSSGAPPRRHCGVIMRRLRRRTDLVQIEDLTPRTELALTGRRREFRFRWPSRRR